MNQIRRCLRKLNVSILFSISFTLGYQLNVDHTREKKKSFHSLMRRKLCELNLRKWNSLFGQWMRKHRLLWDWCGNYGLLIVQTERFKFNTKFNGMWLMKWNDIFDWWISFTWLKCDLHTKIAFVQTLAIRRKWRHNTKNTNHNDRWINVYSQSKVQVTFLKFFFLAISILESNCLLNFEGIMWARLSLCVKPWISSIEADNVCFLGPCSGFASNKHAFISN